jgi:hypothetical protein
MAANIGQPYEDQTNEKNFHSNVPDLRSITLSVGSVEN